MAMPHAEHSVDLVNFARLAGWLVCMGVNTYKISIRNLLDVAKGTSTYHIANNNLGNMIIIIIYNVYYLISIIIILLI